MSMSRKDFELLARTIKDSRHVVGQVDNEQIAAVDYVAKRLADSLKGHSATFDKARFLKACEVPQ